MTSATSDARLNGQHRVLTDLMRPQAGVASAASDRVTVEQPSLMAPFDQLPMVAGQLREILITGGTFDPIYRHILAAPGKRVRAGMVLACARLLPSAAAVPLSDAVDLACTMEMFHEASLVHDDICDGSLLRRDAPSVPAAFGVRTAARAGFHLAGTALQVLARVLADNPAVFAQLGEAPGVTYFNRLSDLSFGQLVETLPPAVDDAALRRHSDAQAISAPTVSNGPRAPLWFPGRPPRRDSVRTRHDRRHWGSTDVRDRVNDCG